MEEVIKAISSIFGKHQVRYAIVGGIAILAWGIPRTTFNVDVVVALFPAQIEGIITDFAKYGFTVPKDAARRLGRGLAVKLGYGVFSVDLRISSFTIDEQAIRRARRIKVSGQTIPIASREDLIIYKLASFGYQDRADIEGILHRHRRIDFDYVAESAKQLAIESQRPWILDNLSEILGWKQNEKGERGG
jgi:hypothetical protein